MTIASNWVDIQRRREWSVLWLAFPLLSRCRPVLLYVVKMHSLKISQVWNTSYFAAPTVKRATTTASKNLKKHLSLGSCRLIQGFSKFSKKDRSVSFKNSDLTAIKMNSKGREQQPSLLNYCRQLSVLLFYSEGPHSELFAETSNSWGNSSNDKKCCCTQDHHVWHGARCCEEDGPSGFPMRLRSRKGVQELLAF